MRRSGRRHDNDIGAGVLLITLGVLFLLDNMGTVDIGDLVLGWWPLILIGIGIPKIFSSERSTGITLSVIGLLLLAMIHDILEWDILFDYWPVLLIMIGVVMLSEEWCERMKARDENRKDQIEI